MKIFIWLEVENVSDYYHHSGGLAVIAESLAKARLLAPAGCESSTKKPNATYTLADDTIKPKVFIFPDAGCC